VASAPRPAAIILAGGASRRMGRDKALLRLPDGSTTLEMTLTSARQVADPVYLAVDSQARADALCRDLPSAPPVLIDDMPGEGPLAALASGLRSSKAPAVLLLSVDAPLTSAAVLRMLWESVATEPMIGVDNVPPFDIAIGVVGGMFQPMPACYASRLADVAACLLRKGERSMHALLRAPNIRIRQLDEAALRVADPRLQSFARANTPEEWEALYARVADGAPGGS
jgi:molybdopterin-guanine dinucleotide biosynthesis protein A